jgi:hypothetical protein
MVVSTSPAHETTGVGTKEPIEIVFSSAMETASVVVGAVAGETVYELGDPTWSSDQKTVRFSAPPSPFAFSTSYTVTVEGSDALGDAIATTEFSFTVTDQPAVSSTIPADGDTGVDVNGLITLAFNAPMERSSVEGAFSVAPSITCAWAWSADSRTVSCKPLSALAYGTRYTATLAASALGTSGDALAAAHTFAFTTAAAPDTTPPTLVSVTPLGASGSSRRNVSIALTFSEQMDPVSTQTAFAITSPAGMMGGTFSWNTAGTVMTYRPPTSFAYGDTVTWTLSTLAEDRNRNRLAAATSTTFRVVKYATRTLSPVATAGTKGSVSSTGEIQNATSLQVGDTASGTYWRAFVTYDLATLSPSLVAVADAKLKPSFTYGPILPAGLGTLYAQSVDYGPDLSFADFDVRTDTYLDFCGTQLCQRPRQYAITTVPAGGVDVTAKVVSDLGKVDRQKRSQFRVAFATNTDSDGVSDMLSVQQQLVVGYEYSW